MATLRERKRVLEISREHARATQSPFFCDRPETPSRVSDKLLHHPPSPERALTGQFPTGVKRSSGQPRTPVLREQGIS